MDLQKLQRCPLQEDQLQKCPISSKILKSYFYGYYQEEEEVQKSRKEADHHQGKV